jgi:hypothetical protein
MLILCNLIICMKDRDKEIQDIRSKPKQFITPESYHIGNHITEFKAAALRFVDSIQRTVDNHVLHVSKDRANVAMDMVSAATRTVLAYKDGGQKRELTVDQKRQILLMAEEVLNGKRECIHLQPTRDCEGIREVFSGHVLRSGQDDILKLQYYTRKK